MIVEDKTITSSPFGTEQVVFTGGPPASATTKKAFKEMDLKLLDPNPVPHDFKACPRCPHPPRPGEVRYAGN